MRYTVNAEGVVQQVSFGSMISGDYGNCTEYTGAVPSGYDSLRHWFAKEAETLYRWSVVNGNLTKIEDASDPGVAYEYPKLSLGVEYLTPELYDGQPVYVKAVDFGYLPNAGNKNVIYYQSDPGAQAISLNLVLSTGCVLAAGYGMDRSITNEYGLYIDTTKYNIRAYSGGNYSSVSAVAVIKYVKN